jgi:Protein of unknown function (DUF433)
VRQNAELSRAFSIRCELRDRDLRIPVATIVDMVADGMGETEILAAYPDLQAEDVHEALQLGPRGLVLIVCRRGLGARRAVPVSAVDPPL